MHARQLGAAVDIAASLPELRLVLGHLGKPDIARQQWEPWASHIAALAALPNVTAKLSGLVTQADWHARDAAALRPYAQQAINTFGPGRLMFGSDWPVCIVAANHAGVHATARELIEQLTPSEAAETGR